MNTTESDKEVLNVTCHSNGSWIPDPADFIQSCLPFTVTTLTVSQGTINKNVITIFKVLLSLRVRGTIKINYFEIACMRHEIFLLWPTHAVS
jgi:hypothetical protein